MTTTTPSTASQAPAVSIDSEEFRNLLIAARFYGDDPTHYTEGKDALVAYIDAKLAKAREDRDFVIKVMAENMATIGEVLGVDEDEGGPTAILEAIERLHAGWAEQIGKTRDAENRATAAEAKLERLETEVQALIDDGDFFMGDIQLHALDGVGWVECVSALLQPQPQADESGLTG